MSLGSDARVTLLIRYDAIGRKYNSHRNADARIVSTLKDLLGLPERAVIVDVGAGTGNYSNTLAASGYLLKAVEPSEIMQRQAVPNHKIEWLIGSAESIPLPDNSADGLISVLAVHHFPDIQTAASEMWRVCKGPMVLFTIDPRKGEPFWFREYFPGIYARLFEAFIPLGALISIFNRNGVSSATVHDFPLPQDLSDLNMHSGWNKPEIYFEPDIRRGMSGFALADPVEINNGLCKLRHDLETGDWDKRFGYLRYNDDYDLGFVFVKILPNE